MATNSNATGGAAPALAFPTWAQERPREFAEGIEKQTKQAAFRVSELFALKHTIALDVVARGGKFSSWHHLAQHLKGWSTAEAGWFDALRPLCPLLAAEANQTRVPPAVVPAFEELATRISHQVHSSPQAVLDDLCAWLCNAESWAEVIARWSLGSHAPLYSFRDDTDSDHLPRVGPFVWSSACSKLVEALDDVWQGYDQFSPEEQARARTWVEQALARHPDFLEAGLALAKMMDLDDDPNAPKVLDTFLAKAKALMPKGFRGHVLWGYMDNRFYHRMLWLRMTMAYDAGALAKCLALCRSMLTLNPGDNLGVREIIPLLHLERDMPALAWNALTKGFLAKENTLLPGMTKAFTLYALGEHKAFRAQFLLALITLPWIRSFISGMRLPDGDNGSRGITPDTETFSDFAWKPLHQVPGLHKACLELLDEPDVKRAEADLRRFWLSFWQVRGRPHEPNKVYEYWKLETTWLKHLCPGADLDDADGRVCGISYS